MGIEGPKNRQEFLTLTSASALAVAFHGRIGWSALGAPSVPWRATPRILSLRLLTAIPLIKMKDFYHGKLGFPVLEEGSDHITIGGGTTQITFAKATPQQGNPFYHVAFNIPEKKLSAARKWQLERTSLLPLFPKLRDPRYPSDVVYFRHWNAHSIYFWDPAGNVLEYIARHDLQDNDVGTFSTKDILYASEIAFVVDDVSATASALSGTFGLKEYRQGSDVFRAVGDEQGLLLVMKRGRDMSFGSNRATPADVFPTVAGIQGSEPTRLAVPNYPYEVFADK